MEKKIMLLFIFGGLVATGFFISFMMTPKSILGPILAGSSGKGTPENIRHCSLNSNAIINQEWPLGTSAVENEDDNIRLTLLADMVNTTEFEDQNFFVEVYNKAEHPIVFPEISGEQYTITGYNKTGATVFLLGGEYHSSGYYNEFYSSAPKKPACFINQGESANFDTSTRIGTKNHNSTTIAYATASVKYIIDGKEKMLQTIGDHVQNESQPIDITKYSDRLLKLVVSPVHLPKLNHYFDVALGMPYPPRLGEEKALYIVARSQYYVGPYTVNLFVPEGLQILSGKTEIQDEFNSESYIDVHGKPVSPIVEQQPKIIRVQPEKAGNYAIQATIYSVFNGTRVGNTDTIWLSVNDSGTSFVSRKELPNSIKPSESGAFDISEVIQDADPVPHTRIADSLNLEDKATYHDPVAVDFSWPDGINWMQKMPRSIFATVNPAFVPQIESHAENKSSIISVNNGTVIKISIQNAGLPPSLLIVDLYNNGDIFGKNENISNFYSNCIIYSPTDINRHSNPYQQCPIESSLVLRNNTMDFAAPRQAAQNEKQTYDYDLNIITKKTGLYTVYVYAQWASDQEIKFNEKYRTADSQFRLEVRNG